MSTRLGNHSRDPLAADRRCRRHRQRNGILEDRAREQLDAVDTGASCEPDRRRHIWRALTARYLNRALTAIDNQQVIAAQSLNLDVFDCR